MTVRCDSRESEDIEQNVEHVTVLMIKPGVTVRCDSHENIDIYLEHAVVMAVYITRRDSQM